MSKIKIVQENTSQKNERYWTDGQNAALSCTITRPMEIYQYWTVPRHTEDDYPILRKEEEAAVQSSKKGRSAEVDNIPAELVQARRKDVITTLKGQPRGPSPWSSHFPRKATCSSARTTEQSASSAIRANSCWRSYGTNWSRKQRRSSLKKRQASELEGAPQSRFSTYAFSVRNISSTSRTSTMSS